MLKGVFSSVVTSLVFLAAATPAAAGTRVPNDMSQCRSGNGGTAALVEVVGFNREAGRVRVQSYTGADNWLESGQWLHRVDIPVQLRGRNMVVCLPLPGPGVYGIGVRHDVNGNNSTDRRDGGGYSGNPDLSFPFNLRPSYEQVSFRAQPGVNRLRIVLNYLQGTAVEPIS